jgi:hypothetical protein
MKKYYLVVRDEGQRFSAFVTDNPKGYKFAFEFEAKNYDEAVKKFRFEKTVMGELKVL